MSTNDRIAPLDLGVVPEAAVSGGLLVQTEHSAYFLFNAMREQPNGRRIEAGTAVLAFLAPLQTRFGHPNDEAHAGHPVLAQAHTGYGIYEVHGSSWLAEIQRQNSISFPKFSFTGVRHFVITLHDSTFECLARDVALERCSEDYGAALRMVAERALREP